MKIPSESRIRVAMSSIEGGGYLPEMFTPEEALELIQQAQTLLGDNAPDAVFSEREGDILWGLEQYDSARAKWNEAIEDGGGKKRLNEKLSRTKP